jgi:YidC/Oxa1 family membrane protein insertase
MSTEQRNLFIAIALSIAILLSFQFLFESPRQQASKQQQPQQTAQQQVPPGGANAPAPNAAAPATAPGVGAGATAEAPATPAETREAALSQAPRVKIDTPHLHGSIDLVGGRIDDLTLATYRETVDPKSPEIVLLEPSRAPNPYFAEFGWVPAQANGSVKLPGAETQWTAENGGGATLTPSTPVTLSWDNGEGLKFERTYAVDQDYMFTITQKVTNTGDKPVTLLPYALINRTGTPQTAGYYILHEGPLGVVDGSLKEYKYTGLKPGEPVVATTKGGWLGITDKYWLTSVIPDQGETVKATFAKLTHDNIDRYQTDFLGTERVVQPGQSADSTSRFFAGAKEVKLLDRYRDSLGIPNFDKAIDFGWFYFLTKPIFLTLIFFHGLLGNLGIAILLLTVIIKALFFPLANKSYAAMSRMKKLQPEIQKLREKYGDDKARINQEMMDLYKRTGANPLAGCLPIVIQIPVFFSLYKVLFVTIEMRHAPFFGWIHDLSSPDPTSFANLFGLLPFTPPSILMIGAWPLIMGVTMFMQQKLNPQPADPVQAKMFMFLPIVFTYMLSHFPAGLVIYWAWNNTLSCAQQWVIMRRNGAA